MAEGQEDRTEEATPRKREEAREEGKIPRSQELTTAVMLLGAAMVINGLGPALAESVSGTVNYTLMIASASTLEGEGAVAMLRTIGWRLLAATAAFTLAMGGVGFVVAATQARGVLTMKPLEPSWDKINPMTNFKQMFGMRTWMELGKNLLKLVLVGWVVYLSLGDAWADSMALAQQAPRQLVGVIHDYSVLLLKNAGLAYLALAAADYFYQLWQHEKGLRMSKQDVKQENKDSEGDPMVKARMRAMGRALARRQMFAEVPRADVVVTNPTHIAVALRYDPTRADAPVVVAMGQRKIAERIKQIAKESGVPTIENKPLARALLASARVGMTIPAELYVAVAEVLAFVFQRRRSGGRAGAGVS